MDARPAAVAGAMAAAVLGMLATWGWIALARAWGVQDEPGRRRLHSQATPRGGGAAVAVAWWLGMALACALTEPGIVSPLAWLALVTGAFLACGLLDDFGNLSAASKLALQVLATVGVLVPLLPAGVRMDFLALGLLCLACLYFVNAWNFMDGSNGMIAGQSLLIALALATWPGQEAGLRAAGLALAGACAGFLPFNFPRARVFLGDAGSLLLGSAVFLLLLASWAAGVVTLVQGLLLSSVVLLDSGLTLARRIVQGKRFWRAHREHLYQYAVRRGHPHSRVALAYAAATAVAWLLSRLIQENRPVGVQFAVPALAWGCGIAAYVMLRRHWLRRKRGMGGQG